MGQSSRYSQDQRFAVAAIGAAISPVLENLERRQFLSVSLNDGVLSIVGGNSADEVQVRAGKDGHFRVSVNGERHYFDDADVSQIRFDGRGGDDGFVLSEVGQTLDLDVVASGGAGDDFVATGAGDDSLFGGAGNDRLLAGKGNNLVVGGAGDDFLSAGAGDDRLFGRAGDDELSNGGGDDTTVGGAGDDLINPIRNAFPVIDSFTPTPTGYDVRQMRNAYGFGELDGNTWTGRGQAIAIIGVYSLPTASRDLATFSREMGIPTLKGKQLRIINMAPKSRRLFEEGWNTEAMLDLQWSHAIAPQAKIYMVQAATNAAADIEAAIVRATRILNNNHGGGVVSMSLGQALDRNVDTSSNSVFRGSSTRNITFVAASGDTGGIGGFPAFSPNVTAVGGTTLYLDPVGNRVPGGDRTDVQLAGADNLNPLNIALPTWANDSANCGTDLQVPGGERAWWEGSGGFSTVFPIPLYQRNRGIPGNQRGIPDVAWNADPATGVSVFNSAGEGGGAGWATVGGTSAGTPQFAGLVAIVNQLRKKQKLRPVGNTLNDRLYRLGGRGNDNFFNDITLAGSGPTGNVPQDQCTTPPDPANAWVFKAVAGWDPATGWGSPNAQSLIPALVSDKISSGRPSGRTNLFQSEVSIRGIISEDAANQGTIDTLSFSGTTMAAGTGTITVQAMTTTLIVRVGAGGPTTGLALVDVYGQDEAGGVPTPNAWQFYTLQGNIVQRTLNQGTGTPFTLVRNGDQVTGFAYITIYDIPIPQPGQGGGGGAVPAPAELTIADAAAAWVVRHAPVKFVGTVSGTGDISGDFYAVDEEGNRVKRQFALNRQQITIQGSIKDI